ncbi:ATP-binding protein [Streptomyces sp. BR123]|uniref:ATP-binding protein n=1 Tax=Streptomyces sp. BR123 TaxID=2749828 RepID=UPI002811982F|nr:ATP-binding protein [Streptomyces sp. BR123]
MAPADNAFWLLPRSPRTPGWARAFFRAQARSWGVAPQVVQAAELALSELVTNAVRHARAPRGREIGVRAVWDGTCLRVEVADAGDWVDLEPGPHRPDGESGRGLAVVAAVAGRWGQEPRPHGIGKTVWAEFPVRA